MKLTLGLCIGAVTLTFAPKLAGAEPSTCFGDITYGKTSLYHTQDVPTNDLSGAATDGRVIVFIDDGGDTTLPNFGFSGIRVTPTLPDGDSAYNLPFSELHTDVEAATFQAPYFYATTSLSAKATTQNLTTRFRLDERDHRMFDEQTVDLTAALKDALHQHFGDDWYNSWKNLPAKSGGLNIEGMSRTSNHEDAILLGLRSPLIGGDFPSNLFSGDAIIAKVIHPFSDHPTFEFQRVALGGYGFRGFEWIQDMDRYVISAGPVQKATDYHLWELSKTGQLEPLDLPGYDQLCRPEGVIQQDENGRHYLVVLSESSGPECAGVPFTYIKAEIRHDCHGGDGDH